MRMSKLTLSGRIAERCGDGGGIRTPDPRIMIPLLYQLSYTATILIVVSLEFLLDSSARPTRLSTLCLAFHGQSGLCAALRSRMPYRLLYICPCSTFRPSTRGTVYVPITIWSNTLTSVEAARASSSVIFLFL